MNIANLLAESVKSALFTQGAAISEVWPINEKLAIKCWIILAFNRKQFFLLFTPGSVKKVGIVFDKLYCILSGNRLTWERCSFAQSKTRVN